MRISSEARVAVRVTATMPLFASVKPWRATKSVRARYRRGVGDPVNTIARS
jgi:hypothetical protein